MVAELAAFERLKKIPIDLRWEKYCDHASTFIFDWNFFILAGHKDMHKSLNELEFQPDPTTDYVLPALVRLNNQCIMF